MLVKALLLQFDNVGYDVNAWRWPINPTLLMIIFQFDSILVLVM